MMCRSMPRTWTCGSISSSTGRWAEDKVQHFSWVTDLRVSTRNVFRLMRGGMVARWKIENETFNTLKNQGYNFEHNYGHGTQNLSVGFATVMMLALSGGPRHNSSVVLCFKRYGQSWAANACCGSACERCFMTMPLRPCASCSKRSCMASRSPVRSS